MRKYDITGMSCSACQARVEKAVSGIDGVQSCAVSLLTNSMGVEGTASDEEIIKAVEKAGYGAALSSGLGSADNKDIENSLMDKESPVLVRRLISSCIVLICLMYLSMGHTMWGWPVFSFMDDHLVIAVIEMILALIVMVINHRFFVSGFRSLFGGAPNMDTLVALGSTASFGYSIAVLILMISASSKGDMDQVHSHMMNLYFESAAMIPTLITVGKLLEAKSKGRTTDALKSLLRLSPKEASVERNGKEQTIPVQEVEIDDIYLLRAGDIVPVDGVVIEGVSAVNEAALTGESIPVDKTEGDRVSAGTLNQNGFLRCRATGVGEDTTLSQIIKMVEDAATTKAPLARIADKVSGIFVPVVILLALLTFAGWMIAGETVAFSIARGISVLVISCPCALGLATPVAIMVGNGMGAKNGILYKTAEALETSGRVGVVVLDKTGTITKGEAGVTDIIPAEGISEEELLAVAYSLEKLSEHPLAEAVVRYVEGRASDRVEGRVEGGDSKKYDESYVNRGVSLKEFETLPGMGVRAVVSDADDVGFVRIGDVLQGGSFGYISDVLRKESEAEQKNESKSDTRVTNKEDIDTEAKRLAEQGKTPLLFISGNKYLGIIAVADQIKDDSAEAVKELSQMGISTVMLTGDNETTAEAIAAEAGVDAVIAGVMPDDKDEVITSLKEVMLTKKDRLKVSMVGDGINDAVALTRADAGFAIGAGTDVAVDAADIVLMKNSLKSVASAIRMSRATIRNIHENLFWAFFYNVLCIPLAMGLYGIAMKPMYGAAAMALSSFFVCMNALRLNRVDVEDTGRDRPVGVLKRPETRGVIIAAIEEIKENLKEGGILMKKELRIEGMMCEHCEATVKKALEAIEGVDSAKVSHKKGTAVVKLENDISDDVLKKAVEDKDYTVVDIK